MNAKRQQDAVIHGNLLRLRDGRAVAIYLRDGVVSVADLKGGFGRILTPGEWGVFHARKLAHAQRRGEVEVVSPIPEEICAVIERLHRGSREPSSDPLKRALPALLDRLLDIGGWRQLPGRA